MSAHRALRVLGAVELATLGLLLLNLVTVHRPALSAALGPLHGLAYTATVIAAIVLADGRHRVWLLALLPGIGGLLAARGAEPIDAGGSRPAEGPASRPDR